MQRPEVRIVQGQEVQINNNPNIDSWEAEQLLRKYGYQSNSNISEPEINNTNDLSFEEMVAQEELRLKNERSKRDQQFKDQNGYSETTYGNDSETGFSFKIEVRSDMNIPKKY